MAKSFILTVDTEGDNLWQWQQGDPVTTKNANYIERFQLLCDRFQFKPVYLINYEMAIDDNFMKKVVLWASEGRCEIGIHLHAWNNPPYYELSGKYSGQPYLIEYPEDIMREKFQVIYDIIKSKTGEPPFSHRAGRWAMNKTYFDILQEFGVKVDCSVTPGFNWGKNYGITCGGSDYRLANPSPYWIGNVLEVPMSLRKIRHCSEGSLRHRIRTAINGDIVWLRPAAQSLSMMKRLIKKISSDSNSDYVELMIHSSELMPGGSPYFQTNEDIEKLYKSLGAVMKYSVDKGYEGRTLKEYYNEYIK
ncbi:deacetylase [Muribaculum caecicola]|uniref:Deacetylase n=1 Tax=Muribaculum caecicola TaxID=3038144 RepID=A0AC61S7N3_9BACT|nr:deacetylase [Muribaculum caecicola]THG54333.1 deacetylase [Muribaculum caecicola]